MLTFNCETWLSINKKTLKILDNLFITFCRIIFRVGVSCPIASFYIQTGSLKFSNFILDRQLNFLFHLAHLSPDSLGRQALEEQMNFSLPGLYQQNILHIQELGIDNLRDMSKNQWRKTVEDYVSKINKTQVLEGIRDSKKLDFEKLSEEKYERKSYLSELDLESARILFRVHSRTVPTVMKNAPSKYRRMGIPLTCPSCSKPSSSASMNSSSSPTMPLHSQSHLLTSCVAVKDISDECMPGGWDDKTLAVFFRKVVSRHLEMGLD